MPSFLKNQAIRYPVYILMIISACTVGALGYHDPKLSIVFFIINGIVFFIMVKALIHFHRATEAYVSSFADRFGQISAEAIEQIPYGALLYNDQYEIEWTNKMVQTIFSNNHLNGKSLDDVSEDLINIILKKSDKEQIAINNRLYLITHKKNQKLVFFNDVTEKENLEKLYREEKTVLGIIFLDNYDDVTQGMDDQKKSSLHNLISSEINEWSNKYGVLLRRVSSDRFIAVMNEQILAKLEKSKFSILDDIKETTMKHGVPVTISIGIGSGSNSLPELNTIAQSGLDLALGRGGDQAVVKNLNEKSRFFGGKTNPVGKRTRVRARVISHALRDLIRDSENVIIMGHKHPDMDVYGAAIGLLRIAEENKKNAYIVQDKSELDSSVIRLFTLIEKTPKFSTNFVSKEYALELATNKTLLIIVDTHKKSLLIEQKLLSKVEKIMVIDHHRRGEEMIENPILSYMEPYASSTSELVSELIEYHPNLKKLDIIEATALLAGIMVDTKSFTLRTNARTFDAASFLRFHGADMVGIQNILKEDVESFVERNKLIEHVYFYKKGIAISKGDESKYCSRVLVAKAADTLLSMEDVQASFVIARKSEDTVLVSGRSLGEVNVQIILEQLNGGGHLTNAATQLKEKSIEETENMLKQAIEAYFEGRNE